MGVRENATGKMSLYNLVRVHTSTVGTADIVCGSAVAGYKGTADITDGDTVSYTVCNIVNNAPTDSEVGHGIFTAATQTITRNVDDSTNNNNKIVLTGTGQVAITFLRRDYDHALMPHLDYASADGKKMQDIRK